MRTELKVLDSSLADESFPKTRRLTTRKEYSNVFSDSCKRSKQQALTVLAMPNQVGHPRLGLAIARKQIRFAVARNRIKRAIRESFRHHQHCLGSVDFVVLARSAANQTSQQALYQELTNHWCRLRD